MPATTPSIVLPSTFGRYALFDFIGKGGMAEIYLARQKTELGAFRRCVVKKILPELANHPTFADMLVHEAKLAARLSHANVVQVFDLGRAGDRLFIAMEYVEGFDLNDLLRRCSRAKVPLPWEMAVHVMHEALRGLDYAHRRVDDAGAALGVVHRDVSPSNLLVSFEGEVKVCDFGIARANEAIAYGIRDAGSGAAQTQDVDDALKGKAGYMSPEHARGEEVDARADVFAAGIVLWELAAGRRMYKGGEGRLPLLDQARSGLAPELPETSLPAEKELRAILARALSPGREGRYPTAAAMLRDLEAYEARAGLMPSPLKLGDWLASTFGSEILAERRARERAAAALEKGMPVVLEAVATFKDRPVTELQAPEAPPSVPVYAPTPAPAPALTPAPAHASAREPAPAPTSARTPPRTPTPRRLPPVAVVAAIAVVAMAAAAVVLAAR